MAGRLTIQRPAWGLLSTFALKGSGESPIELSDKISVCFEANWMYLYELRAGQATASGAFGAIANGYVATQQVPSTEIWVVTYLGFTYTTGVGVSAQFCPAVQRSGSGAIQAYGPYQAIAASQTITTGLHVEIGNLILRGGDTVGVCSHSVAGGVPTGNNVAEVYRIPV
jgi:hypothetical protein